MVNCELSVVRAIGIVLVVCIGVRIAAAIIEPVFPALITLAVVVFVLSRLLGGPGFRAGRDDWLK